MAKMMRAARLHSIGEPFQVDTIPVPEVRPTDVLVEVKAAGVVPNLRNLGLITERTEEQYRKLGMLYDRESRAAQNPDLALA